MVNSQFSKKVLLLLIIVMGLVLGFYLPSSENSYKTNYSPNINEPSNEEVQKEVINDKKIHQLESSTYSQNYESQIENSYNVSIQQSYVNNTYNKNLDPNNSNNNTFSVPTPKFGFNSSITNITINNIVAPNKSLNLELGTSRSQELSTYTFATSFEIIRSCILYNFSLYFREAYTSQDYDADVTVFISNATQDGPYIVPTGIDIGVFSESIEIPDDSSARWYNFSVNKKLYDSEMHTYNNTYFICFFQTTLYNFARARYYYEEDSNGDNSFAYISDDYGSSWINFTDFGDQERDISSQVILSVDSNETPLPSEIGLKINNSDVYNVSKGTGFITIDQNHDFSPDELQFSISADWYDVSCNAYSVTSNFTRIGYTATTSFNSTLFNTNIYWNVSLNGAIVHFDEEFSNYIINFEIPSSWVDWRAYNNTTPFVVASYNPTVNGFRNVTVINAGNGNNWYLTANSTNLLYSIDPFIEGSKEITHNSTRGNRIKFNATFSRLILENDGNINLTVFNAYPPNRLNYTSLTTSFSTGKYITLQDYWDIDNNLTIRVVDDMNFTIQVRWNNISDAGFFEINFTVNFETNSTIDYNAADLEITGYRGQIYHFTFNYTRDSDNRTVFNALIINEAELPNGLELNDIVLSENPSGNDYYLLEIDTTDLEARLEPYHVNLSVYNASGYDQQPINLTLNILRPRTELMNLINNLDNFNVSTPNSNVTILFSLWDTIKNEYIYTLTTKNVTVSMNNALWDRSDLDFGENGGYSLKLINSGNSNYSINISTYGLDYGVKYDLQINITYESIELGVYQNSTFDFYFYYGHVNTSIDYIEDLNIVGYRGQILNYTFNYTRDLDGLLIPGALLSEENTFPLGIQYQLIEGMKNYTIQINTTDMIARIQDYDLNFSVYSIRHQPQPINLTLTLLLPKTEVLELSSNLDANDVISPGINVTLTFKVNDTLLDEYITSLETDNVSVTMGGTQWDRDDPDFGYGGYLLTYLGGDLYELKLSTYNLLYGHLYPILINISYTSPDGPYNYSLIQFFFYYGHANTTIDYLDEIEITGYRGQLLNFTLNYTRDSDDQFIMEATITLDDDILDIEVVIIPGINNYTIQINTTGMQARLQSYLLNFTIKLPNHQSQYINITLTLLLPKTEVLELSSNLDQNDVISPGINVTLTFKVNDTLLDEYITSLGTDNVSVTMGGTQWDRDDPDFGYGGYLLTYLGGDLYELKLSTYNLLYGHLYPILINISYTSPDGPYNYSLIQFFFYYGHANTTIDYLDELEITGCRGQLLNFTLNYTRDSDDQFITEATITLDDEILGIKIVIIPGINNYTIQINTTGMEAYLQPYLLNFTVQLTNHESQYVNITLTVLLPRTELVYDHDNLNNQIIASGLNVSLYFQINDTLLNQLITGLDMSNFEVTEGGNAWNCIDDDFANDGYILYDLGGGDYQLNFSTLNLNSGEEYILIINITYTGPNGPYNYSIYEFIFYFGTELSNYETSVNYTGGLNIQGFREEIVEFTFNYTREDGTIFIPRASIVNTTTLPDGLKYVIVETFKNYTIQFNTTGMLAQSTPYKINFTVSRGPYEVYYLNITLRVLLPLTDLVNLTNNFGANSVVATGSNIILEFVFYDTLHDIPILILTQDNITITDQATSLPWVRGFTLTDDGMGNYTLEIITTDLTEGNRYILVVNITYASPNPGPYENMIMEVDFYYGYNPNADDGGGSGGGSSGGGGSSTTTEPTTPPPTTPDQLTLEDFIPFMIIGGIVIGGASGGLVVYKKTVVPKKMARMKELAKKAAIKADAKSMELLMIVYKEAGLSIYSKAFTEEIIDPNLITGFITAICNFGKELKIKEELNEIKYKEKVLLIADGTHIRATLVLSKKPSVYLNEKLKNFIEEFETKYEEELPIFLTELKGRITVFKENDELVNSCFPELQALAEEYEEKIEEEVIIEEKEMGEVVEVTKEEKCEVIEVTKEEKCEVIEETKKADILEDDFYSKYDNKKKKEKDEERYKY